MFLKCDCGSDTVKVEVKPMSGVDTGLKVNVKVGSRIFLHCAGCGQVTEIVLNCHPTLTLEHCEYSEEKPLFGQDQLPRANSGPELLMKG